MEWRQIGYRSYAEMDIWDKVFQNGPKVFKGSLPEILLGPFLNTLSIISFDPVTTPQRQKFPAILSAVIQVCN